MPVNRTLRRSTRYAAFGAALLALAVVLPSASGAGGTGIVDIELVPLGVPSPGDTTSSLPVSLIQVGGGDSFVVEVWARTSDLQGISSVSASLSFDPAIAIVSGVTHSVLFSQLISGDIDNVAGLVTGLSGSHLSSCVDQVGVAPIWARVAIIDMQAVGVGSLVVGSTETGVPALGTAICGVGDLLPADVAYGSASIEVIGPDVPAVSQWGVMAMTLLLMVAGSLAITRRMPRSG